MDRKPRPIAIADWAPPPDAVQFFRFVLWRVPVAVLLWLLVVLATGAHVSNRFVGFGLIAALVSLLLLLCALKFTEWFTLYLRLRRKDLKKSFLAAMIIMQGEAKTGEDYGILTLDGISMDFEGLQCGFSLRNDRLRFLDKSDLYEVNEHCCVQLESPNMVIGFRTPGFFTFKFKSDRAINLSQRMRAWNSGHGGARPQRCPPLSLMHEARITVADLCFYTAMALAGAYSHIGSLFKTSYHALNFWAQTLPSAFLSFGGFKHLLKKAKTRKAQLAFAPEIGGSHGSFLTDAPANVPGLEDGVGKTSKDFDAFTPELNAMFYGTLSEPTPMRSSSNDPR